MSRGRRALVLGVLALLLGGIAASDVAEREAALERRAGPLVPVVVARSTIERGDEIKPGDLALRRVPERYAPRSAFGAKAELVGARAGTTITPGTDMQPGLLAGSEAGSEGALATAGPGERIARIVAVGSARELPPGSRTDLLVTRERAGGRVRTSLALRDAEVVEADPAPDTIQGDDAGLPRVALALRVSLPQALYLAEAQSGARELRALPRPPSASRRVP